MDALATVADLEGRLGRTLSSAESDQAALLLDDVSASVRGYTGQHFTEATTTDRLPVRRGRVTLPQRPVSNIDAVADVNGNQLSFVWHAGDQLEVRTSVPDSWSFEPYKTRPGWVDVTYTHGYEDVPGDIVAVVCQIAGRVLGQPADTTGMHSESIDDYSYTVGAAAAAGGVGMMNDERAVLDRYKRVGGTAALAW